MKKIASLICTVALGAGFVSCSDFLDRSDTNTNYSSDGFFQGEQAIHDGLTTIYSGMYMNLAYNVPHPITFECFTGLGVEREVNITIGAGPGLTPENAMVQSFWSSLYTNIARINAVISGAAQYESTLNEKSKQYLAEAHVLRGLCYYYLIALWGDVPFFDEPVTIDQYEDKRTPKADVLDFIIEDIDQIAEDLPWTADERGRVDRAFARGLQSRAALLGGSLDYDGRGQEYFRIAADRAQQVFGNRDLAENFDDLFNVTGQAKDDVRNELLYELTYNNSGGNQIINMIAFGQVSRIQGQTGRHPTAMMADTYECIDGKRIDESPLYDPQHPQRNRDPRFHSTLWMHGDTCTVNNGSLSTIVLNAYDMTTYQYNYTTGAWEERNNDDVNSTAAWASYCNRGCGYIWAKFCNETVDNINAGAVSMPIMRYAEVLLNYAEAKIELNEIDQTVYDAIDKVRGRVGMPGVLEADPTRQGNQEKMRQIVRRERKVEFADEGMHYFDMRRWGIGDLENATPTYGMPLSTVRYEGMDADDIPNFKTSTRADLNDIPNYDAYKEKLTVRDENRYWDDKFNLWPIPQLERDRNPNLGQNEGY